MKHILKLKFIAVFVLLIGLFSAATYVIRNWMYKKTNEQILDMAQSNSRGYTKLLEYNFENYYKIVGSIDKKFLSDTDKYRLDIDKYFDDVLKADTIFSAIAIIDSSLNIKSQKGEVDFWKRYYSEIKSNDKNKQWKSKIIDGKHLVFSYSPQGANNACVCAVIELDKLHQKFIVEDVYTSVYQIVLNKEQKCIYHPDETYLGKRYDLPDHFKQDGSYVKKELAKMHYAFSNYLGMAVYKNYNLVSIGDEEWLVISVSPGFEISDIIAGQEKTVLILFLLFVLTLIGIILYGVTLWKNEYQRRMITERQNLNLQLKHSEQKNETIAIKLELLRSGLNSHFLFNSLGTLKALLDDEDVQVKKAFTDLSKLYRYQLRIEGEQTVSVKEEFEFSKTYVRIINLRLGNAIVLETSNLEDYYYFKILPISLQTLIDNCIKHNIASHDSPLIIKISVEDEMLVVKNELKPKISLVETNGKGLANLQSRYALLVKKKCYFYKSENNYIATIPLIAPEK